MPLTTARSRLFELAEVVRRSADDTTFVLEQRGHAEAVALVREARLKYLEERVAEMEKTTQQPFVVAGSLTSPLKDDDLEALLKELRKAWGPVSARRR